MDRRSSFAGPKSCGTAASGAPGSTRVRARPMVGARDRRCLPSCSPQRCRIGLRHRAARTPRCAASPAPGDLARVRRGVCRCRLDLVSPAPARGCAALILHVPDSSSARVSGRPRATPVRCRHLHHLAISPAAHDRLLSDDVPATEHRADRGGGSEPSDPSASRRARRRKGHRLGPQLRAQGVRIRLRHLPSIPRFLTFAGTPATMV